MKNLIFIFITGISSLSYAVDEDCLQHYEATNETRSKLPLIVRPGVEFTKIESDCQGRKITGHFHIDNTRIDEFLKNKAFQQEQWMLIQCDIKGMSRHGWTYIKQFYDHNENFIMSLEAKPEMCTEEVINACRTEKCLSERIAHKGTIQQVQKTVK